MFHAVAGWNIANGDRRKTYQLDWPTLFSTVRACRAAGDEIVGFFHSHPNGSCEPSKSDLEGAWPEQSYLILGAPYHDVASAASWRVSENGDAFVRERLRIACEGDATERGPVSGTAAHGANFGGFGKPGGVQGEVDLVGVRGTSHSRGAIMNNSRPTSSDCASEHDVGD